MKYLLMGTLLSLFTMPTFVVEIPVLSVGVGEEERYVAHDEYSLRLVFFEEGGAYVANVLVFIYDQNGRQILKYLSEGPWLYVNLASGDYSVRAERQNGDAQGGRFSLDGRGQKRIALRFDRKE